MRIVASITLFDPTVDPSPRPDGGDADEPQVDPTAPSGPGDPDDPEVPPDNPSGLRTAAASREPDETPDPDDPDVPPSAEPTADDPVPGSGAEDPGDPA